MNNNNLNDITVSNIGRTVDQQPASGTNPNCVQNCQQSEHKNSHCRCNTSDQERAGLLQDYLEAIKPVTSTLLLLPLDPEGKAPVILDQHRLNDSQTRDLLHSPEEAIKAIEQGKRGFALYAGRPDYGTENLVFTDHDDVSRWPPETIPETLKVISGSGSGYHQTYVNQGDVGNAFGKDEMDGAGEVRAENWYVVTPGSIHPSGGIYHMVANVGVAKLAPTDLPDELRPASSSASSETSSPESEFKNVEIESLPRDFSPVEVRNSWGASLGEIRGVSSKLDTLLETYIPPEHPSTSEADMATVALLLYWGFDEDDIANIIRSCRNRTKMRRDDYVSRTIARTTLTKRIPIDPDLGQALVKKTLDREGEPPVSPISINVIGGAFRILGGKSTITELVDSGLIPWEDSKRDSVRRRATRVMEVFEEAGYVSWTRDGRTTVWTDEGLDQLQMSHPMHSDIDDNNHTTKSRP